MIVKKMGCAISYFKIYTRPLVVIPEQISFIICDRNLCPCGYKNELRSGQVFQNTGFSRYLALVSYFGNTNFLCVKLAHGLYIEFMGYNLETSPIKIINVF